MLRRFRQRHPRVLRTLALCATLLAGAGAGAAYGAWAHVCDAGRCPSVSVLDQYQPAQTSKLYAADGRFIAEIGNERRTVVKLNEIPQVVRDAFVVTEDKRFYSHAGIDWIRVFGAAAANVMRGGWAQGFSTITMQLARNVFPERISREKTLVRKLKEAKVARAIEARYPKNTILELYLNQIYLGNGAHGVETASQRYFGKSVKALNLSEAAMLAALPKAPERYNPRRFPDRAIQRRNTIVELMRRARVVNDADASLAKAYPLQLASRTEAGDVAPYFVEWVRQALDAKFGQRLYAEGLKVYTTLDVDLQSAAERALENQLRAVESGRYGAYRHETYEQYLARAETEENRAAANSPYLQGMFVALDPRTGAVRALVGGRDFDDSKFNRATQALRQPGSTFKPVVYADAVQNGRSPAYLLDDSPLEVPMGDGSSWKPQNYDGKYEGLIPMRRALYQSRNIPAIRMGQEMGEASVIDMARRLGLTSPIPAYPSIFIGAAEVYPIELVAAYSTFATLGTRAAPFAITRVETMRGEVLWTPEPTTAPVLSPEESWLMVSMMRDVVRRGTAAGSVGSQFSIPAGGKTGTTNDGTDVWFVGYTADLVAGVWMGFDKPKKIKANAQGGQLAAPAWTAFMKEAYRRKPAPPDWPRPGGIVTRVIDFSTGLLSAPGCRGPFGEEFFIVGTEPTQPCDLYAPMPGADTGAYQPAPYPYPPLDTAPRLPVAPPPLDTFGRGAPGQVLPGGIVGPPPPPPRPRAPRDTARPGTIFRPRRDSVAVDTLPTPRPARDVPLPPRPDTQPPPARALVP
ncbi:MAG: penicillin-binding protein 1A [Gemmatimonadaceae bacterium]